MRTLVTAEIRQQIEDAHSGPETVISESDIAGLPEPVQRYVRYAGVVGKSHIRFVRLRYEGFFRRSPEKKWGVLNAEQTYTTDPPSLIFHAAMGTSPIGRILVRERYKDGKGNFLLQLWPGITIANVIDEKTDIDMAIRYLNEMVWFPTAYVKPYNQWEAIDTNTAKVTHSYQGVTVSAIVSINDRGEMVKFVGQKHIGVDGSLSGKKRMIAEWTVILREYEERLGFQVPTSGEAIFHLHSGDFEYIKISGLPEIEYDTFSSD